jgi:Spy/CpxP family protein refolding chaperone
MKKFLIIACVTCVLTSVANANEPAAKDESVKKCIGVEKAMPKMPPAPPEQMHKIKKAHEKAFEEKLGLTEVQKLKTRELRKGGHEKIKPLIDDIRAKKQEAEAVRNSKLTVEAKEEKLTEIDKELATMEKKVREVRKQNMKEFEKILTKDQRKTLKNMKKEGRKNFEEQRKNLVPPPCKPITK